jgi:hypothetical protein
MDNEYYNIEIDLTAQESEAVYDKGNIYLSAVFTSYNVNE